MASNINVNDPRHALRVVLALLVVYIIWGTTYLAITVALQSMPALTMNGLRFLLAGVVMLSIARLQGHALPSARQWRHAAVVGGLMAFLAMTLVVRAQKLGIGSGLMATVVTTMPMWLALWSRMAGESVPRSTWAGLALGMAGAVLLALERDFSTTLAGALCAFGAPLCWSLGSFASRRLDQGAPATAAGAQWLTGGAMGMVVALWFEPQGLAAMSAASTAAWWAWAYLLVGGTLVTLNAYLWLLKHTRPALAGSYAFVNPAVALLIGVWLGGELLSGWVYLALPLIFAALGLILYGSALRAWLARIRLAVPLPARGRGGV